MHEHGGLAQLVERLNGIQEVRGSTPLSSTTPPVNVISTLAGFFLPQATLMCSEDVNRFGWPTLAP